MNNRSIYVETSSQYIRFFSYWLISFLFMGIWIYHGLIPKIWGMHSEEVTMLTNLFPFDAVQAHWFVTGIGALEIVFGLAWLLYKKRRSLFISQTILFPILTVDVILANPVYVIHPFNPITFNISLWIISIIGLMVSYDVPTARSCKRRRAKK